jgi:hypothetical protein
LAETVSIRLIYLVIKAQHPHPEVLAVVSMVMGASAGEFQTLKDHAAAVICNSGCIYQQAENGECHCDIANKINGLMPLKAAIVAADLAMHQLLAINMRTNMPDLHVNGSWPLSVEQNEILLGSNILCVPFNSRCKQYMLYKWYTYETIDLVTSGVL